MAQPPRTEAQIRNSVFIVFSFLYLILMSSNADMDWMDDCLLAYSVSFAVAAACTIMYVYWWFKTKAATEVYKWVTFMFVGMLFSRALTFIARILYVSGEMDDYHWLMNHWVWYYRTVPETLVSIFMLSLIVGRLSFKGEIR